MKHVVTLAALPPSPIRCQTEEDLLDGLIDRTYALSVINLVLTSLTRCDTLESLATAVVPPLLEATGADEGRIVPQGGPFAHPEGVPDEVVRQLVTAAREGWTPGRASYRDAGSDERFAALLPLGAAGTYVGALWLLGPADRQARLDEAWSYLLPLSGPIGLALAQVELIEDLQRRALQDALTGLFNHGHFQARLQSECDRAGRYGSAFSLVLVDIDHFKRINDTYGHPAGDRVLAAVADAIRSTIRQSDLAARYGGEEFAILLPETPGKEAVQAAERLRDAIRGVVVTSAEGETLATVTASLGVASFRRGEMPGELLARTDRALYRAKRNGRDRICTERGGTSRASRTSTPTSLEAVVPQVPPAAPVDAGSHAVDNALKELDRIKSDFLSNASHELRTPLAAIVGYAEFLEDQIGGPLTSAQREFVAGIQAGAQRLTGMIEDMLDLGHVEARTLELTRGQIDLAALASARAAEFQAAAVNEGITLVVETPDGPVCLMADERRVGQAIDHLLDNAVKFTPRGGQVRVSVTVDEDRARCEVRDSGIGIPHGQHAGIFQKFHQVDPSITRLRQGAGLGLFVVRALIEAHGGQIAFESEFGEGSSFWFTLPLRTPTSTDRSPGRKSLTHT